MATNKIPYAKVMCKMFWCCLKSIHWNRSFSQVQIFTEEWKMSYRSLVAAIPFLPISIKIFIHYGDQNQSHRPISTLSSQIGLVRMPGCKSFAEILCSIFGIPKDEFDLFQKNMPKKCESLRFYLFIYLFIFYFINNKKRSTDFIPPQSQNQRRPVPEEFVDASDGKMAKYTLTHTHIHTHIHTLW